MTSGRDHGFAETGHVALPIAGARSGGADRGLLVRRVTATRAIAVVSADAGHTLPQDEQRESRGARGSRLLRWQRDSAAKLITRACLRAIWQSQRCVISQGEARVWPAWDRRPATRPGPAAQTSTPWSLRPLCTEARRTGAIGTALMTSAGPALTYGAPRGIGNAPCAGVLADHEPGPVGTPAAPSRVAR